MKSSQGGLGFTAANPKFPLRNVTKQIDTNMEEKTLYFLKKTNRSVEVSFEEFCELMLQMPRADVFSVRTMCMRFTYIDGRDYGE